MISTCSDPRFVYQNNTHPTGLKFDELPPILKKWNKDKMRAWLPFGLAPGRVAEAVRVGELATNAQPSKLTERHGINGTTVEVPIKTANFLINTVNDVNYLLWHPWWGGKIPNLAPTQMHNKTKNNVGGGRGFFCGTTIIVIAIRVSGPAALAGSFVMCPPVLNDLVCAVGFLRVLSSAWSPVCTTVHSFQSSTDIPIQKECVLLPIKHQPAPQMYQKEYVPNLYAFFDNNVTTDAVKRAKHLPKHGRGVAFAVAAER